jgi:zinc transport system substrate-binding protein
MNPRMPFFFLICFILSLSLTSCPSGEAGKKGVEERTLTVITTLFPLYDFTREIGQDRAKVTLLLPPGVEAHSFEPKPGDMLTMNSADVFIFTGSSMEPWAPDILKGLDNRKLLVIDASARTRTMEAMGHHGISEVNPHEHGVIDPHIWLDFSNAMTMVDNIQKGLSEKDPSNGQFYARNSQAYKAKLANLDRRFKEGLSSCKKRLFVHGGHFAFNYLARRYGLHYMAAFKGSPDAEPSPRDIVALKRVMKERDIKYIFYEELISPRVAQVLSGETGATLIKLHGAHNISKDDMARGRSFISIMEENLRNLRSGLQCS